MWDTISGKKKLSRATWRNRHVKMFAKCLKIAKYRPRFHNTLLLSFHILHNVNKNCVDKLFKCQNENFDKIRSRIVHVLYTNSVMHLYNGITCSALHCIVHSWVTCSGVFSSVTNFTSPNFSSIIWFELQVKLGQIWVKRIKKERKSYFCFLNEWIVCRNAKKETNFMKKKTHDMVIYKLYREGGAQLSGKDYIISIVRFQFKIIPFRRWYNLE